MLKSQCNFYIIKWALLSEKDPGKVSQKLCKHILLCVASQKTILDYRKLNSENES